MCEILFECVDIPNKYVIINKANVKMIIIIITSKEANNPIFLKLKNILLQTLKAFVMSER